jgi:hypothetical protein
MTMTSKDLQDILNNGGLDIYGTVIAENSSQLLIELSPHLRPDHVALFQQQMLGRPGVRLLNYVPIRGVQNASDLRFLTGQYVWASGGDRLGIVRGVRRLGRDLEFDILERW